jgi:hypothetical protein
VIMSAPGKEKILLAIAVVVALGSAGVFGTFAWRNTRTPRGPVARVTLSDMPYTPTATDAPAVKTDLWSPPIAQSRGRDWIYDTFTPPEIFYNARSKHFTVKPPLGASEELPEEPFGLELIAVRPEPFRLQLIGYVGGEGDWRGTFQNLVTGEVFLAAAGRRVPNLALSIKALEVRTVDIALPHSMTTRQRVATAIIHDDRTKRDVTLSHRERQFTGGLAAFVAATGETATREVRERETFKLGEATYRVEKISLAPPAIDVTKESPSLTQPDRRTLSPREADDSTAPSEPSSS